MTNITSSAVRRDLQRTRLYYFVLWCSGFVIPYLNLFYNRLGLTGAEIGTIGSVAALVTLLFAPLWTTITERASSRRGAARLLLQLSLVLTGLCYLWLSTQTQYIGIVVARGMLAFVGAGIIPLSDALAVTVGGAAGAGFGSIRMWSSLGWIFFVLSGGWLNENVGSHAGFIATAIFTAGAAFVLFTISPERFSRQSGGAAAKTSRTTSASNSPSGMIALLLRSNTMIGIALMLIVVGIGNSGVLQFENIYLSELGASDLLIGLASVMSAIVEVPFMLWADRQLSRHSPYQLLMFAMVSNIVLRLMVLVAPSPLMVILTRAVSGIGFSFYTVAMIRTLADNAPHGQTRTVMALYNITLVNVINIAAAPLAGAAFDLVGARWLFLISAISYALAWVVLRRLRPQDARQGSA